jgi:hypothetical protein
MSRSGRPGGGDSPTSSFFFLYYLSITTRTEWHSALKPLVPTLCFLLLLPFLVRHETQSQPMPKDSVLVERYESGARKSETPYVDGIKHGLGRLFYESGAKKGELPFSRGLLHGKVVIWYQSGAKRAETPFINGRQHGIAREWSENGRVTAERKWEYGKRIQ